MPAGQDIVRGGEPVIDPDAPPRRPFPLIRLARLLGFTEHRCPVCGTPVDAAGKDLSGPEAGMLAHGLCPACARALRPSGGGRCRACGLPLPWPAAGQPLLCGDCLASPPPWQGLALHGQYRGALRRLILRFKHGGRPSLAFLLAGLPAGWSNESLGMLLVLLALGACVSQQRTGRHLPLWAVAGLAGAVAGWLALIAAPGNMARAAALGTGLVPLASWKAFHSFLIFWGTQQLELLPLYLLDLGALAFLHHRRELSREIWLPALLLFLMGHACIAAFVLSPSRADRAMTAGYFWLVLSTCALLFRLPLPRSFRITARLVFLLLFVSSLWQQAQVFRQAAPLVAARNEAVRKDILDVRYLDYPGSDKYFYPSYHTRDAILMDPAQDWGRLVPWQDARPLPGMPGIRAFTTSHMLYLDGVDDSPIHLACHTHEQTIASLLREVMLHTAPPPVAPRGANALNAWFKPAVTRGRDGKALLHLQGLRRLEDIAYIGREDACGQVVWHRLDWRSGNSSRP